jgi:hypothetical protein
MGSRRVLPVSEQAQSRYDLFVSYAPADQEWVKGYLLDVRQAYLYEAVACPTQTPAATP